MPEASRRPIKDPDAEYRDAERRLRHAAFALSTAISSQVVEDREMADAYLKEAARAFVDEERKSGRKP
jgi:hypothetical protein